MVGYDGVVLSAMVAMTFLYGCPQFRIWKESWANPSSCHVVGCECPPQIKFQVSSASDFTRRSTSSSSSSSFLEKRPRLGGGGAT